MLHGARDAAPSLLAGLSPIAEAATRWPLLRAASLGDVMLQWPAAGSAQKAAAALHVLLRSVAQDAGHCESGVECPPQRSTRSRIRDAGSSSRRPSWLVDSSRHSLIFLRPLGCFSVTGNDTYVSI